MNEVNEELEISSFLKRQRLMWIAFNKFYNPDQIKSVKQVHLGISSYPFQRESAFNGASYKRPSNVNAPSMESQHDPLFMS